MKRKKKGKKKSISLSFFWTEDFLGLHLYEPSIISLVYFFILLYKSLCIIFYSSFRFLFDTKKKHLLSVSFTYCLKKKFHVRFSFLGLKKSWCNVLVLCLSNKIWKPRLETLWRGKLIFNQFQLI